MLSKLEFMLDDHFGRISTVSQQMELIVTSKRPIHLTFDVASLKAYEYERIKINKMIADNII